MENYPGSGRPRLGSTDIKSLRVFIAIVEAGSFSGAQTALNVSASTISTQITALEQRFGMRLCTRGRTGFQLTESGKSVVEAARHLFSAHNDFESEIWHAKKSQQSVLKIGVVDSVIGNPKLKLQSVLAAMADTDYPVELHLLTLTPSDIEQMVLSSKLDVGIGAFRHRIPGLAYQGFMTVNQILYCSKDHPLFNVPADKLTLGAVIAYPYVARTYLAERQPVSNVQFQLHAHVQSIEAAAMLIQSGKYIGHLPDYYPRTLRPEIPLKAILPNRLSYKNRFGIVRRRQRRASKIAQTFIEVFARIHHDV